MKKNARVLSEEEIERALANVNASMLMEGFVATEEEDRDARRILSGEADADELIAEYIKKHKR